MSTRRSPSSFTVASMLPALIGRRKAIAPPLLEREHVGHHRRVEEGGGAREDVFTEGRGRAEQRLSRPYF